MLGLGNSLSSPSEHEQLYSISLDGTGDFMDTGDTFQSTFRDSFSISFWVKLTDGVTSSHQILFGTKNADSTDGINFANRANTGLLYFKLEANNDFVIQQSDAAVFTNGQDDWKHIVVTVTHSGSGNTTCALYVHGSVIASTESSTLLENNQDDYTTDINPYVGAYNSNGSAGSFVTGNFDQVAIWDVALDADAVDAIYNGRFDLTSNRTIRGKVYDNASDLVAYWKMNDGSGTTVVDYSGNGNNGTLSGDATFSTDTPDD